MNNKTCNKQAKKILKNLLKRATRQFLKDTDGDVTAPVLEANRCVARFVIAEHDCERTFVSANEVNSDGNLEGIQE